MSENYISPVEEFIEKFEASKDPALWKKLIEEETKEVIEAYANLMKEIADLIYVSSGLRIVAGKEEQAAFLEEHMDKNPAMVFITAYDETFYDEVRQRVYAEVHRSNMTKLDDNGKPIKREDGKILKGPNYQPANTLKIVEEVANEFCID